MTVADFLTERLSEWSVSQVYGYSGDGINGVMGALREAKDRIDFIQVRHEESAAFMACAHAKFTDQPGVCIATGDPKFQASQELPDVDFSAFARQIGLSGVRIDRPDQVDDAWTQAFRADKPFVIDAVTDPEVPTTPPHITFEQARNYLSSALKGDAERLGFIRQTAKDFFSN